MHRVWVQDAVLPRLKRVIVLLHKIGDCLHAAQSFDHPSNIVGSKLIASFLSKLAISLQPGNQPAEAPQPTSLDAEDAVMADAAEEEVEEVGLLSVQLTGLLKSLNSPVEIDADRTLLYPSAAYNRVWESQS